MWRILRFSNTICASGQTANPHFCKNSGLISAVFLTWFFNAAQRSAAGLLPVALLAVEVVAICAKFMLNLSFSSFSNFSFFFIAPGLLFRLFLCILACPTTTSPFPSPCSKPDRASARDSRFVTSFLFGRRRFWIFEEDFSILLTKSECLVVRLSFLEEEKSASSSVGVGRVICGRAARDDFARADVRFLPEIGA
ncbi:hypothetical protein PMIN07_003591 [Paraphaeosphaeria minitans]